MFICSCCNYETLRKDAFDRHKLSKRHISNMKNNLLSSIQEVDNEDIDSEQQNDIKQDGGTPIYTCHKCGKKYKTKSSFVNHYDKCNFVHSLQCPKCMKCFKHKQSKSKHIKNNNCKPVSRIHSGNNTNSVTNNITINNNITNNNTINNFYINNYGNERLDHISDELFIKTILKSVKYHIIPIYIENKHFHKDFPENHNIQYSNKKFLVKENDSWNIVNGNKLAQILYRDNGHEIHRRFLDQNELIQNTIQNDDIVEFIRSKINYLQHEVTGNDKEIKREIIDVIMSKSNLINV